jgi:hypothetical protein
MENVLKLKIMGFETNVTAAAVPLAGKRSTFADFFVQQNVIILLHLRLQPHSTAQSG